MLRYTWLTGGLALFTLALNPVPSYAQHYHGHGHGHVGFGFYGGYYPWSFYYAPFFGAYWYPYPYPYTYPVFYPPYGWYGAVQEVASSVRVEVVPREAKVYVDGYFAGVVDDFDGTFQRLHVAPGKHDVVLFLEGYHLLKQTVYLSPNSTYKIKGELTKLGPGDRPETPPTPPPAPSAAEQARALPDPFGEPHGVPPAPPAVAQAPPDQRAVEVPGAAPDSRFGRLAIRVQPQGAEVYIDGEKWLTPDTTDRLLVNIAEGRHHVEVHKTGFDSFSIEVDVRRGETSPVNVSLPPRAQ